jgi:hypothetical protein
MKLVTKMRQSFATPSKIFTTGTSLLAYLNTYVEKGITMHPPRPKLAYSHISCL